MFCFVLTGLLTEVILLFFHSQLRQACRKLCTKTPLYHLPPLHPQVKWKHEVGARTSENTDRNQCLGSRFTHLTVYSERQMSHSALLWVLFLWFHTAFWEESHHVYNHFRYFDKLCGFYCCSNGVIPQSLKLIMGKQSVNINISCNTFSFIKQQQKIMLLSFFLSVLHFLDY